MKLAGVIDVRVERGDGEGDVARGNADRFPVERRGDLQRDLGERGMAVVADGEQSADADLLRGGAEMHVHVECGEGDGLAFGVGGNGSGDLAASCRRGGGAVGGGGLAVLIDGAGKDDGAVGLLVLRGGGRGLGDGGERREIHERDKRRNRDAGEPRFVDSHVPKSGHGPPGEFHEPRPFCFFGLAPGASES